MCSTVGETDGGCYYLTLYDIVHLSAANSNTRRDVLAQIRRWADGNGGTFVYPVGKMLRQLSDSFFPGRPTLGIMHRSSNIGGRWQKLLAVCWWPGRRPRHATQPHCDPAFLALVVVAGWAFSSV